MARMPLVSKSQPLRASWRLSPLFLACSKCGATLYTEHQASRPMILRFALNPPEDPEPSLEDLANGLPLVFTDTGAYVGKILGVEEGAQLRVIKSNIEESCPASRFVFFHSRAAISSEPITLLLMPEWFEELPEFVHQLDHYEARIRPLLTMLANQKISEASFTMLLGKYTERFQQAEFRKARFFKEVLETEIARIAVSLETLEAQRILGERSVEEFLLKKSMLSQIKGYLELVVSGIAEATSGTHKLSEEIRELVNGGSISPITASRALAIAEALVKDDQRRQSEQPRRSEQRRQAS